MYCLYFICERKFYARTHVKITRHWKSSLTRSTYDGSTGFFRGYIYLPSLSINCLFPPHPFFKGKALGTMLLKGFDSWVVKRATSMLFNSFCSNVAKQVSRFFFTVLPYL